jgi:hypothetical protein
MSVCLSVSNSFLDLYWNIRKEKEKEEEEEEEDKSNNPPTFFFDGQTHTKTKNQAIH